MGLEESLPCSCQLATAQEVIRPVCIYVFCYADLQRRYEAHTSTSRSLLFCSPSPIDVHSLLPSSPTTVSLASVNFPQLLEISRDFHELDDRLSAFGCRSPYAFTPTTTLLSLYLSFLLPPPTLINAHSHETFSLLSPVRKLQQSQKPTMSRPLLKNSGENGWIVQKFGGTSVGKFPEKVSVSQARFGACGRQFRCSPRSSWGALSRKNSVELG